MSLCSKTTSEACKCDHEAAVSKTEDLIGIFDLYFRNQVEKVKNKNGAVDSS